MSVDDPAELLETFDNPRSDRSYSIEFACPEFTSLCPKTGHPDFATIIVRYRPGPRCVELRSLKLYFQAYRSMGIFFVGVINKVLDDLVAACEPREMAIVGRFNARGGISHELVAEYPADDGETK